MITSILVIVAVGFIGYAVYANYHSTDPTKSVGARVVGSIIVGLAAVAAAVVSWFTTPPVP